jgi:hypothetical protein
MSEKMYYKALAQQVLIVAVVNETVGDWSAYIDAVAGYNHRVEYLDVPRSGTKLDRKVAEYYFGSIAEQYRWRD